MKKAAARKTERWVVGKSEEIPERSRLVVDVADKTIGIFRVDNRLYAYENVCAHVGGPVCQGLMVPRVVESLDEQKAAVGMRFDEKTLHIVCPWHGYEYDIVTGAHSAYPRRKLKRVAVSEENGTVYVTI